MATYTGLSLKLKDKNTSVPDKLKLAKFAWATENVHIPNKHQYILDFICGLLVNRKKHQLDRKDIALIWQTLEKFLNLSGSSATVKPSILQVVTEDLCWFTQQDKSHKKKLQEFVLCVIRCTQQLFSFSSITTAQFENLSHLFPAVCNLSFDGSLKSKLALTQVQNLLESLTAVLERSQRLHLNQSQVLHTVTEKLLGVSLKLLDEKPCQALQNFLLGCLLHSDHMELYATYLKYTTGEQGQGHIKQAPKAIANVFTVLISSLMKLEESSESLSFLPAFIKAFVHQNKSEPRLCFLLLKHLIKTITPSEGDSPNSSQDVEERLWIRTVAECVVACQDCDFTSAGTESNDILKWFFQLTEMMLQKHRSPAWFRYLRAVLGFNHLVIEKYWDRILQLGFTSADKIPDESFPEQDLFLTNLVSTYMKLRRSPELLTAILSSVEESACGIDVFGHLPQFYNKDAPPASLLEMWEGLQSVAVKLTGQVKKSDSSSMFPGLQWTLSIYAVLLNHTCLFDHRVASVLHQKVLLLVEQLEGEVLLQLYKKKEIGKCCPAWSELLSAWTMVKMLLFPKWRESSDGVRDENKTDEVREVQDCQKLFKGADPVSRAWLAVQRRNLVAIEKSDDEVELGQTTLEAIAADLLELPALTRDTVFKVWDGQTAHLSASDLPLQKFQQFSQLFPLIGQCLSESVIDTCVDLVVSVLSLASLEDLKRSTVESNLFTEVQQFLAHPAVREVELLQEKLSARIWKVLLQDLTDTTHSPRKKKRKIVRANEDSQKDGGVDLSAVVQFLIQMDGSDATCSAIRLSELKGNLPMLPCFPVLVHTLRHLDLDFLPTVSLRCQVGALVMLATVKHSQDMQHEVETDIVQLLIQCLSASKPSKLFECVDPADLMEFTLSLCAKRMGLEQKLLEVTTQAVMNDREAVSGMTAWTKKLTEKLRSDKSGQSTTMTAVTYVIRYCRKYVTKSHHSPKTRESALEIFFTLTKFIVKHGLEWCENASLARRSSTKHSNIDDLKKRKRKRHRDDDDEVDGKKIMPELGNIDAGSMNTPWCALLIGISEVLNLWSKDVVDDKFNEHLAEMVAQVMKRVMADLKSDSVSLKVKESGLRFLESVCHCHLRCNSGTDHDDPPVSGSEVQSDSLTLHSQTAEASERVSMPSSSLCLLTQRQLEKIWNLCYDSCVCEFSCQLERFSSTKPCAGLLRSINSCHSNSTKDTSDSGKINTATQHEQDGLNIDGEEFSNIAAAKTAKSHHIGEGKNEITDSEDEMKRDRNIHPSNWLPDAMDSWPPSVIAHLDVLTAVLECCDVKIFGTFLEKMLLQLMPTGEAEVSVVFVVVAVWRRMLTSPLLSNDHIKELFKHMYQFLSTVLSTVQHFGNLTSPFISSSSAAATEITPSSSPIEFLSLKQIASRFILDALSDFIDLGKTMVTPRMTLLCLQAAVTFPLTCSLDLQAVYRLLNTLLVHHTNTALTAVPTVLTLVNKLITACIKLGNEDRVAEQPGLLQDLTESAQLITRLLTLLSSPTYKIDLAKVAYTVLAEYVMALQKGKLHMTIKRELVRGMHKLMTVCDRYRLAALNAALPPGVKDTFKFLHQDYEKYHRYSGTV